jgi:hypothetical protein
VVVVGMFVSAAGSFVVAGQAAQATDVNCSSYSFSSANYGRAYASGCNHRGAGEKTRLRGDCEASPFYAYSPTVVGTFSNMSFRTESCRWGVNGSIMQHNF